LRKIESPDEDTGPQSGIEEEIGFDSLSDCTLCPRECHADRRSRALGYCQTGTGYHIASICEHAGEEPVLCREHGICNVFFTHCNMQCIYCQNAQISRNQDNVFGWQFTLDEAVDQVERILDRGVSIVGFVSPSHVIPQMRAIIARLEEHHRHPIYVMNTNAYDRVKTLASLEGVIDIYLPDLKYMDGNLAGRYSDTPDYPKVATAALVEMFRQKGAEIALDRGGLIRSGLIVRHLVLPGQVENSKQCLQFVAEKLSPEVHVSLMSQYHPTPQVALHPELGRPLHPEEYEEVLAEMDRLGLHRGWMQEMDSQTEYLPDFSRSHPFQSP
jgi:putative pyruvate formate lyase activating enzyme